MRQAAAGDPGVDPKRGFQQQQQQFRRQQQSSFRRVSSPAAAAATAAVVAEAASFGGVSARLGPAGSLPNGLPTLSQGDPAGRDRFCPRETEIGLCLKSGASQARLLNVAERGRPLPALRSRAPARDCRVCPAAGRLRRLINRGSTGRSPCSLLAASAGRWSSCWGSWR